MSEEVWAMAGLGSLSTSEAVIVSQLPLALLGALLCYEIRRLRMAIEELSSRRGRGGERP